MPVPGAAVRLARVGLGVRHARQLATAPPARQGLLKDGPSLDDFLQTTRVSVPRGRQREPKPKWLQTNTLQKMNGSTVQGQNFKRLKKDVKRLKLATVCEEAKCPNIGECWGGGDSKDHVATATIMVMGDTCTRGCRFCSVKTSRDPPQLEADEPERVAEAVTAWGLDYVVLTSVDRDDYPDGGADHLARTVEGLKRRNPALLVECLTPDFRGDEAAILRVARSGLEVHAHNIETVERLQRRVRDHRAGYAQSLRVLEAAKAAVPTLVTKSSIMLGLGETTEEVRQLLTDLRGVGVGIVTLGQYLRPTRRHMKVESYVHPDEFDAYREMGEEMGFDFVAAGPMVRSSYRAGELFVKNILRKEVAEVAGVADTTAELDLASLVQGSEARRGKLAAAMRGS